MSLFKQKTPVAETTEPQIDAKILEKLSSKKQHEREIAEKYLDSLGDTRSEAILRFVQKEAENRRNKRKCVNRGLTAFAAFIGVIVIAGVMKGVITGKWDFFGNIGHFFSFFSIFGAAAAATQAHKNAAHILAQMDDLKAVGPLFEARELDDKGITQNVEEALTRLLPRLTASDAHLFSEPQRESMARALKSKDSLFVIAVLRALEQVGDEKALPEVQKLLEKKTTDPLQLQVKEAAQECLPFLKIRAEQAELARTLLRASSDTGSPDTLLRPAHFTGSESANELLRAADTTPQTSLQPLRFASAPKEQSEEAKLAQRN
jgi:hypothetical protein